MINKEKFTLKIMLQKMGLTEQESILLIDKFEEYGFKYERIIKRKNIIYPMIDYFKKCDYSNKFMNKMISVAIKKYSAKKILNVDKVLKNNNYNIKERENIEFNNTEIFNQNKETLEKKLCYYNENNLKQIILKNPKGLVISLELSHARIELFKRKKLSLHANVSKLFEDNTKFKYDFGINSENLKRMYPLPEKYLKK